MNWCSLAVAPYLERNPYRFSYFYKGSSSFIFVSAFVFSSSLSSCPKFPVSKHLILHENFRADRTGP